MPLCKLSKDEKVELQKLVDAYDNARSSLVDFLTEVQGEWEEEMEEKSDKWKEGEAGTQAQDRLDTLCAWIDELPAETAAAWAVHLD